MGIACAHRHCCQERYYATFLHRRMHSRHRCGTRFLISLVHECVVWLTEISQDVLDCQCEGRQQNLHKLKKSRKYIDFNFGQKVGRFISISFSLKYTKHNLTNTKYDSVHSGISVCVFIVPRYYSHPQIIKKSYQERIPNFVLHCGQRLIAKE